MSTPTITADMIDVEPADGELSDAALDVIAELLIDAALMEEQDK